MKMSQLLRVPTPPMFSYHSNLVLSSINWDTKVSSKTVVDQVAATEHAIFVAISFLLSARDASTCTVDVNEVLHGCSVSLYLPDPLARNVEAFRVYDTVRASGVGTPRALRSLRVARAIDWSGVFRTWPFLNFDFGRGEV